MVKLSKTETAALRVRLKEVEGDLRKIKEEMTDHYFDDRTVFAVLLFLAFAILAGSFAWVFGHHFGMSKSDGYELLSYVLPSCAGIIGGYGIYFRKRPGTFFCIAAALVIAGLACYMLSKQSHLTIAHHPYAGLKAIAALCAGACLVVDGLTLVIIDFARRGRHWKQLTCKHKLIRIGYCALLVVAISLCYPFYLFYADCLHGI